MIKITKVLSIQRHDSHLKYSDKVQFCYRVSRIEMYKVNWLRQIDRLRFSILYLWLHGQEVMKVLVLSTSFQKSNIVWTQQLLPENVLKCNMIFQDSTIKHFFHNIKIKLNSRPWTTLNSYFIKELPDPYGWIISGTKMTNDGPFLCNGSSKIQFFTDI